MQLHSEVYGRGNRFFASLVFFVSILLTMHAASTFVLVLRSLGLQSTKEELALFALAVSLVLAIINALRPDFDLRSRDRFTIIDLQANVNTLPIEARIVIDLSKSARIPLRFLALGKDWSFFDARVSKHQLNHCLVLSGGARLAARKSTTDFRSLVLHELAHIANADFFAVVLVQSAMFMIVTITVPLFMVYLYTWTRVWDQITIAHVANIFLIALVYAIPVGTVWLTRWTYFTSREFAADARAVAWGGDVFRLLDYAVQSKPPSHLSPWRQFIQMMTVAIDYHPNALARRLALEQPIERVVLSRRVHALFGFLIFVLFGGVTTLFLERESVFSQTGEITAPIIETLISGEPNPEKSFPETPNIAQLVFAYLVFGGMTLMSVISGVSLAWSHLLARVNLSRMYWKAVVAPTFLFIVGTLVGTIFGLVIFEKKLPEISSLPVFLLWNSQAGLFGVVAIEATVGLFALVLYSGSIPPNDYSRVIRSKQYVFLFFCGLMAFGYFVNLPMIVFFGGFSEWPREAQVDVLLWVVLYVVVLFVALAASSVVARKTARVH